VQVSVGSVNIEGSDPDVRPQDDLFGHVNGQWLRTAEIPSDLPMAGAAIDLVIEAEAQVDQILRDAAAAAGLSEGSPRQQIGDLYASFMAEDRVEALGAAPLENLLA
jgi:putative endopeptidase